MIREGANAIHFVGAGPGASDLITVRGRRLLRGAGMIVYAGSLVNPALLDVAPPGCEIRNSASMTLDEVIEAMADGYARGSDVVRLHTGDPSLYGAIREQMDRLRALDIPFEVVPGVSSFCAAAAALEAEYTLPGVSQTLILTRMEGRTPVPPRENIRSLAAHGASMALFLSAGMTRELVDALIEGGCATDTPSALVYKASWPDQKILRAPLAELPDLAEASGIRKTALILVGGFLGNDYSLSRLYDRTFTHGFRKGETGKGEANMNGAEKSGSKNTAELEKAEVEKKCVVVAFTRAGADLASRLAGPLNARVFVPERFSGRFGQSPDHFPDHFFDEERREALCVPVGEWAKEWWGKAGAFVFVSAAGIAVRAVAPLLRGKAEDPAVVVLDDAGQNAVPLLSGHIGGANALARKIAALTGGRAVITTATDVHGIEAVDEWAVANDCAVENPEAVKSVSASMLDTLPTGVAVTDERLSPPWPVTLWLRPRVLFLGVGCRRGTPKEALETAVEDFLQGAGVSALSLKAVASLDRKRDEPAIVEFCRERNLPFLTFGAEALRETGTEGGIGKMFSFSARVFEITGLDNVCERAAVKASRGGPLLRSKTLYPGIALALARAPARPVETEKTGGPEAKT